jgi:hypothetical protein
MNDLITRARKEWCETRPSPYSTSDTVIRVCPPEVMAALLDVLESLRRHDVPIRESLRLAVLAEAAVTRALEGKT